MNGAGEALSDLRAPDPYEDAITAARLCAIEPGLGGIVLRGGGDVRDAVVAELRTWSPDNAPIRRVPLHIHDDHLLGGIDLTATLAKGATVSRRGLLAEADGGVVVLPMAERLSDATAGRIAAVMDTGDVMVERDGVTLRDPARFALLALDDGVEPDERAPAALAERLAFWIDLSTNRRTEFTPRPAQRQPVSPPAMPVPERRRDDEQDTAAIISAIATVAAALGIESVRAPLFALRAARAFARLAGRPAIADEDVTLAARLVLAPRATRLPPTAADAPAAPPTSPSPEECDGDQERSEPAPLEEVVLAATLASLPRDVLSRLAAGGPSRTRTSRMHGAGEQRTSSSRGRPIGTRAGMPGGGRQLSLIDTLRAAAPWQRLRGRTDRVLVRRDDLRIRRFETRAEAVTIFAVDASGSSAMARLAEAKGAVELLLAEAYVKRAHVALVAFRGSAAELLLPPTRSLVRARRSLADLPGGGGTPLAAGLNAARELAETARTRGRTPFVVILTDGRANIALDGSSVRVTAQADAQATATAIGAAGIAGAFVDISARPRPEGAALAAAMRARYLPLPRADAATMHAAVNAARPG